ncbi:ZPR1 zinc finger domain-containing protein [Candidatus Woesearchaeota archaeon]|nr:ZPR1 zinc finger domain-containing protein [Candidatus Woesearchaeota archaeon]
MAEPKADKLEGQTCPVCKKNTLTLTEREIEVPFFGRLYIFSMQCSSCDYKKSDVEAEEQKEPVKWSFEIESDKDMGVRIVKSSEATVKIPRITTIEPGPASEGYISNVEGLLEKIKEQIENIRDTEEDPDAKKKAKNLLKKITRIIWGKEKAKIIIEDPSGNSAIISEKAVKGKL